MITAYSLTGATVRLTNVVAGSVMPPESIWIDLLNPTPEESRLVQQSIGLSIPMGEEVQEIEVSSRLYLDRGATYMTADIVAKSESLHPETQPATFILTKRSLITVRYADTHPFQRFRESTIQQPATLQSPESVFLGLVEAIVGRAGQMLRILVKEHDEVSRVVFWQASDDADRHVAKKIGMQTALHRVGHMGELASRIQQSLVSLDRLLVFYEEYANPKEGSLTAERIHAMQRDIDSLSDHASFLSQKVSFLLDATLGFIGAEQNQIIKLFSVASVILLPPTLVATVYGMNFDIMPELMWPYGYPFAIILMFFAGFLPYLYFKKREWI